MKAETASQNAQTVKNFLIKRVASWVKASDENPGLRGEVLCNSSLTPTQRLIAFEALNTAINSYGTEHAQDLQALDGLFARLLLLISIECNGSPPWPSVLKFPLEVKDLPHSVAYKLGGMAWDTCLRSDASRTENERALIFASIANALCLENANILNTLGVAQYRNGQYREAIASLLRSESLLQGENLFPSNGIFLAMARFQLGEADESRALLEKVRQEQQKSGESLDEEDTAFLNEAEELIKQVPTP